MNCKYCHLNTHYIDTCPTIICKNCKDIGHPQWLCKQKKNSKNNNVNNVNNENKYSMLEDIKKKTSNETSINKNINYYLKLSNEEWGNFISID
jgi:hypothetical protein